MSETTYVGGVVDVPPVEVTEELPAPPADAVAARVDLTPAAAELLIKLTHRHGPLMFHQSGGCCDGSAPMCYPDGEFKTGAQDVHLGDLAVPGLDKTIDASCRSRSTSTGSTPTSPSTS